MSRRPSATLLGMNLLVVEGFRAIAMLVWSWVESMMFSVFHDSPGVALHVWELI